MQVISTGNGKEITLDLVNIIVSNREYLSEIDGAIGDGDHGINMAKGFNLCAKAIADRELSLSEGFEEISDALMEGIGGSMGPLYGSFFMGMSDSISGKNTLSQQDFLDMLKNGLSELQDISSATVGDKCLMDALIPAVNAFEEATKAGKNFKQALDAMQAAAVAGRDSTVDLVAKIGRASRLGERSRGVLDAGATSCCLLLCQLAQSIEKQDALANA
ncbi:MULTISPECIES: dihydroxyacetone kinase subunit DhaL [Providencia]|uniref:dihydroxyacetone kinase subunit DhaL n=1 Tax=Providencia TaxID=586 RepID=UPI002349E4A0|nr:MULTISPECIES: dihydroxyacetone kinase subunit DhaL [unclassified Providencia]